MEVSPHEENRKEHKRWQVKCRRVIRQANTEFEEPLLEMQKLRVKILKYMRSRLPVDHTVVGLLDDRCVKGEPQRQDHCRDAK